MTKAGESILRGAREALAYARWPQRVPYDQQRAVREPIKRRLAWHECRTKGERDDNR